MYFPINQSTDKLNFYADDSPLIDQSSLEILAVQLLSDGTISE